MKLITHITTFIFMQLTIQIDEKPSSQKQTSNPLDLQQKHS